MKKLLTLFWIIALQALASFGMEQKSLNYNISQSYSKKDGVSYEVNVVGTLTFSELEKNRKYIKYARYGAMVGKTNYLQLKNQNTTDVEKLEREFESKYIKSNPMSQDINELKYENPARTKKENSLEYFFNPVETTWGINPKDVKGFAFLRKMSDFSEEDRHVFDYALVHGHDQAVDKFVIKYGRISSIAPADGQYNKWHYVITFRLPVEVKFKGTFTKKGPQQNDIHSHKLSLSSRSVMIEVVGYVAFNQPILIVHSNIRKFSTEQNDLNWGNHLKTKYQQYLDELLGRINKPIQDKRQIRIDHKNDQEKVEKGVKEIDDAIENLEKEKEEKKKSKQEKEIYAKKLKEEIVKKNQEIDQIKRMQKTKKIHTFDEELLREAGANGSEEEGQSQQSILRNEALSKQSRLEINQQELYEISKRINEIDGQLESNKTLKQLQLSKFAETLRKFEASWKPEENDLKLLENKQSEISSLREEAQIENMTHGKRQLDDSLREVSEDEPKSKRNPGFNSDYTDSNKVEYPKPRKEYLRREIDNMEKQAYYQLQQERMLRELKGKDKEKQDKQ